MSKYDAATLAAVRERVQLKIHRIDVLLDNPGLTAAGRGAGVSRRVALGEVVDLLDFLGEPCAFGDPAEPEHDHEACRDASNTDASELDSVENRR